jgi:hypothetical protein
LCVPLGPTISAFGAPNVLADPTLELRDLDGTLITSNDNWKDTQQAEIQASGKAPPNDNESAIIIVRPAANNTAIVRGKNNTGNAPDRRLHPTPVHWHLKERLFPNCRPKQTCRQRPPPLAVASSDLCVRLRTYCEAIVLVASSRNSSLVFPSQMSFTRCAGIILTGAALLFSISCEKHHLGEYPEIQKDLTATLDEEASNPAPGGSATPTPVKFFPEKKAP